jgi:acyl dehydratase
VTGRQPVQPSTWGPSTVFADDIAVGTTYPLGTALVTEDDILSFASQWDPQYFHVDPQAAAGSPYGGLIASGIHTVAVLQRLAVEAVYSRWATIAARGIRDLRFTRPVRPGTELTGVVVVADVQPRGEHRSLVTVTSRLDDVQGDPVLEVSLDVYVARRPQQGLSRPAPGASP